jgi:hypothetical protein
MDHDGIRLHHCITRDTEDVLLNVEIDNVFPEEMSDNDRWQMDLPPLTVLLLPFFLAPVIGNKKNVYLADHHPTMADIFCAESASVHNSLDRDAVSQDTC